MMAANEDIIEPQTETIDSHHIETSFAAKPMDMRDASSTAKLLVHPKFMF